MPLLRWLGLWSAVILLPYFVWVGYLQVSQLALDGGTRSPAFAILSLISGASIAFLAIVSVGLIARPDGTPTHFANVLTCSLVASYILIDPFMTAIVIWPYLLFPALVAAVAAAIAIWVFRRRRANPTA
jgi:hypothetical protein